jgi:hypothetical protein
MKKTQTKKKIGKKKPFASSHDRATNDACAGFADICMAINVDDKPHICTTIVDRIDRARHEAGFSADPSRWRGMWRSKSHHL